MRSGNPKILFCLHLCRPFIIYQDLDMNPDLISENILYGVEFSLHQVNWNNQPSTFGLSNNFELSNWNRSKNKHCFILFTNLFQTLPTPELWLAGHEASTATTSASTTASASSVPQFDREGRTRGCLGLECFTLRAGCPQRGRTVCEHFSREAFGKLTRSTLKKSQLLSKNTFQSTILQLLQSKMSCAREGFDFQYFPRS